MKNCPNCNAQLPDDAVFCTNCGTNLGAAPVQPPVPQQPQQQYQQPPYQQPAPAPAPEPNPFDHTDEFSGFCHSASLLDLYRSRCRRSVLRVFGDRGDHLLHQRLPQ